MFVLSCCSWRPRHQCCQPRTACCLRLLLLLLLSSLLCSSRTTSERKAQLAWFRGRARYQLWAGPVLLVGNREQHGMRQSIDRRTKSNERKGNVRKRWCGFSLLLLTVSLVPGRVSSLDRQRRSASGVLESSVCSRQLAQRKRCRAFDCIGLS